MGVPPCGSSQVEPDGEGKCRAEDCGDKDRVSLEESVVDDLVQQERVHSEFLSGILRPDGEVLTAAILLNREPIAQHG